MIYVIMSGRLGNQLFMYAAAEALRQKRGRKEKILINDYDVNSTGWMTNQLKEYDLPNVEYESSDYHMKIKKLVPQMLILRGYMDIVLPRKYLQKYEIEKKMQPFFNLFGLMLCQNGYIKQKEMSFCEDIILLGYFQSEKYFHEIRSDLLNRFDLSKKLKHYPLIDKICSKNSVCITVKVESNAGNKNYGVCGRDYWIKAINYVTKKVVDPVFFLCSDDVDYVIKNELFDLSRYEVICQPQGYSANDTLYVMSLCKHFIISNSSYSWWAQYLSTNQEKIVIAPSRWMAIDMPVDIYQSEWIQIEV